jgi:hypothetical protein
MGVPLIVRSRTQNRNFLAKKSPRRRSGYAESNGRVRREAAVRDCFAWMSRWLRWLSRSLLGSGAGAALYGAHRTAKTAREGRAEQRAADGYLKVLSLAQQEAQWHDSRIWNLSLDPQEVAWRVVDFINVEEPPLTDKPTAFALIAAFASDPVRTSYTAWREAADALDKKIEWVGVGVVQANPHDGTPDEWMKELTDVLQPKEREARKAIAEAIARELGHR